MFGTPKYKAAVKLGEDGELSVQATATVTYGEKSASRSVDVALDEKDAAKVTAILKKAAENATVPVTVRTGELDADGELKTDKNGSPLKQVNHIPLGQQVFNDAAQALVTATNNGEKV